MKRIMRNAALLTVVLLATTACTRRVQVESEPNQPNYLQSSAAPAAATDFAGEYEYVVGDAGGEVERGPMTVTRGADGVYAVRFGLSQGGEVVGSNVRREGNQLLMDVLTPGGQGTLELTWENANEVVGVVFLGEIHSFRATRRP